MNDTRYWKVSKMWECSYINTTDFLQVSHLYVEFSKIAVISKFGINFLFFWPSFSVLKKGPKKAKNAYLP